MRIALGRLRRRSGTDGQAAGTLADERGSRASDRRRDRLKAQQEAKRELSGRDPRTLNAWNSGGGTGMGF